LAVENGIAMANWIAAANRIVVETRRGLVVDLLYSDHEGGQRTISRFSAKLRGENETDWRCAVVCHWALGRPGPAMRDRSVIGFRR
jgi:hypothetical protein